MAHPLSTAPSFGTFTAAWKAHTASVTANGGQHPTSVAAARAVIVATIACKKELGAPLTSLEGRCNFAESLP